MKKENIFKNKNILITGGAGFIGSNLAHKLIALNAQVTIVDSLIPEYGGNLFNIKDIEKQAVLNISDVRDAYSMRYLVQGHELLFNLAGQTSHMDSMQDPFTDLEINSRAQLSILESCRKYNPEIKIIFASTRQIYGTPQYLPVDEKHPLRPVDVNGINKLSGEWYHLLYNNVYGIRSCVLRLTNTIGPRMRIKDARQTFLGIWVRLLLENKAFEVWGGEQLRDFTDVDDCVDAMLMAAAEENVNGQVFNLGGECTVSLKDLAQMLVEVNGKGHFICRDFPSDRKKIDIGDYYSDFSLIRKTLNWEPRVSLKKSLEKIIAFYRENLEYYI